MRPDAGLVDRLRAGAQDAAVAGAVSGVLVWLVLVVARPSPAPATLRGQTSAAARDAMVTVLPAVVLGTLDDLALVGALGGKGRTGLAVRRSTGAGPSVGRAVLRNLLKLFPWQLAHLGVRQQVSRLGGRPGDVAGRVALVAALAFGTADVLALLRTGDALHDRLSGTRVRAVDVRGP
jgi:hypothetical protein